MAFQVALGPRPDWKGKIEVAATLATMAALDNFSEQCKPPILSADPDWLLGVVLIFMFRWLRTPGLGLLP